MNWRKMRLMFMSYHNMLKWNMDALGDVDHRKVKAPYIRLDSYHEGSSGDVIYKYDIRITQPNEEFISKDKIHSLEHFFLDILRSECKNFVGVAPMGCNTGLYLFLLNLCGPDEVVSLIVDVFNKIGAATEVPLASTQTCGHANCHNLEGAQEIAKSMLACKNHWLSVFRL